MFLGRSAILFVLCITLCFHNVGAQHNNEKAAAQKANDDKVLTEYFTQHNLQPKRTKSGLYYLITTWGNGLNARRGQRIKVNYTGKTLDGHSFDSNQDPAFKHTEPFVFNLGRGAVIKGWDEGFQLLNKGAKATLFIPSGLAYGTSAIGADIPANSILVFDVEVLDFDNDN